MKIEDHLRNINESLDVIRECIEKGIEERQRNISFNVSVASTEMLEVFLHRKELINPSSMVKHDFFSSVRKASEHLSFDFENKQEIFSILVEIESKRNFLCYGKKQPVSLLVRQLELLNKLKELLEWKDGKN